MRRPAGEAPPVQGANSVAAITRHVFANVSENILGTVGGQPFERDRDAEFAGAASTANLLAHWDDLRPRLRTVARSIPANEHFALRQHPRRGRISVFEVFLVVLRHVGEHEGHAQLTRDWLFGPSDAH